MNTIDFSNLGGFPFTQQTLEFMQSSYSSALSAIAKMVGNKTIISGCVINGSNVTDGWIAYDGELIPFVGGTLGTDVIISTNSTGLQFEDQNTYQVLFEKVATTGSGGVFPFLDLIRLTALQNMWLPGDVKEKVVNNQYIIDNFDVDGYGLNRETGWRILSKAYPAAAGKMTINLNPNDTDFNETGKNGGAKTHTLTESEMPSHRHPFSLQKTRESSGTDNQDVGFEKGNYGSYNLNTGYTGGGQAHNNMPPYFVTLKLIKL